MSQRSPKQQSPRQSPRQSLSPDSRIKRKLLDGLILQCFNETQDLISLEQFEDLTIPELDSIIKIPVYDSDGRPNIKSSCFTKESFQEYVYQAMEGGGNLADLVNPYNRQPLKVKDLRDLGISFRRPLEKLEDIQSKLNYLKKLISMIKNCIRNGVELYSGSRQLRRSLEQETQRLDPSQKYIITCLKNLMIQYLRFYSTHKDKLEDFQQYGYGNLNEIKKAVDDFVDSKLSQYDMFIALEEVHSSRQFTNLARKLIGLADLPEPDEQDLGIDQLFSQMSVGAQFGFINNPKIKSHNNIKRKSPKSSSLRKSPKNNKYL